MFIHLSAQWSPAFAEYYKASLEEAVMSSADFATRHLGITAKPSIHWRDKQRVGKLQPRSEGLSELEGAYSESGSAHD